MKAIFMIVLPVLLYSCSGTNHKEDKLVVSLQQTLDQSSDLIKRESEIQFDLLKNKQLDPITSERANRWLPIAEKVKNSTGDLVSYVSSLQDEIKKQENFNPAAVSAFFNDKSRMNVLSKSISSYHNVITGLDEGINRVFKKEIDQVNALLGQDDSNNDDILSQQRTNEMILVMLSSFKSKLRITENAIASYCNSMASPGCILRMDKFGALVSQSAKILKPGDELIITAGVGAFSNAAMPAFRINNKDVPPQDGRAEYKMHVMGKPGNYSIPVSISYVKEDGTKDQHIFTVEYTIFDPQAQ